MVVPEKSDFGSFLGEGRSPSKGVDRCLAISVFPKCQSRLVTNFREGVAKLCSLSALAVGNS